MTRDDCSWPSDSIVSHSGLHDVMRTIDIPLVDIDDVTHDGGGVHTAAADGCSSVYSNSGT
jgi:hypothetical protein